jgi:glutamate-1-semialdehyde 2,1-aminomutase
MKRNISNQLFEEAKNYFPGGVNSPVRAFKSVEGSPLFIHRGDGDKVYDEDSNSFIDFCCSWGPLIHGHNHPYIREKVEEAVKNGLSFGTPTRKGVEIGKLILDNHRFIDKLRFVCSGTEAVMSAIRLARGFTNKNKIIKFDGCYHGHVDSLLVKAGSGLATFGVSTSAGIPDSLAKETIVLPLNDLAGVEKTLEDHAEDIACIIIEPIPANNGLLLQDTNFLVWLRKLCDDHKVLLIFDEVISGFRAGFEGAAGYYNVEPDIITFGKIIGGGMPVGAFGGKAEIMAHVAPEGPVYQAGTLSANPIALTAGMASLELLLEDGFYENLEAKTKTFVDKITDHTKSKGYAFNIQRIGSIFWIAFTDTRIMTSDGIDPSSMDLFKLLHKHLLERGVYLGPSGYEVGFVSSAHSEASLNYAATQICEVLDSILA